MLFKGMSDKAISDYNNFVASNNSMQIASKQNTDILEKIAIKGLAEQYYDMNESVARKTWERFVDSQENHDIVGEWLAAMAHCLFVEEDEVEDNSFLAQKRKADMERESNRKAALRKKR